MSRTSVPWAVAAVLAALLAVTAYMWHGATVWGVQLQSNVTLLKGQVAQLQRTLAEREGQLNASRAEAAFLRGQVADLQARLNAAEARISDLSTRLSALNSTYLDLRSRYGDLQARYGDLQSKYGDLQARYSDLEARHAEAQRRLADYGLLLRHYADLSTALYRYVELERLHYDPSYALPYVLSESQIQYVSYAVRRALDYYRDLYGQSPYYFNDYVEAFYRWIKRHVGYALVPSIPYITGVSWVNYSGVSYVRSFTYSKVAWIARPPNETLSTGYGNCYDQAVLLAAMVLNFLETYSIDRPLYLAFIQFDQGPGHAAVIVPSVTRGYIAIFDPAGLYMTNDKGIYEYTYQGRTYYSADYGKAGFGEAQSELQEYARWWQLDGRTITYMELYRIEPGKPIPTQPIYRGTPAQIAQYLG